MNEKIEIIKKWFEKADHDLDTAQLIYLHIPEYRDTIPLSAVSRKIFKILPPF